MSGKDNTKINMMANNKAKKSTIYNYFIILFIKV